MKSAQLMNGDIVLSANGEMRVVEGKQRLVQELRCWLLEPLGTDPVYPSFGSTIPDMVGEAIVTGLTSDIEAEVARVLSNYMAYQQRALEGYIFQEEYFVGAYDSSEILESIRNISATQYGDMIVVNIVITTMEGEDISLQQQLLV